MYIPNINNVNSYRDLSFTQVGELKKLSAHFSFHGYDVTDELPATQQNIYQLKGVIKTIDDSLKQKRTFGRVFLDLITFQFIKRIMLGNALPAIKTVIRTLGNEVFNEKLVATPPAPRPAQPGIAPSFGLNAFEVPQEKDFPVIKTISQYSFNAILGSYPKLFHGNHPKNFQKSIHDLVWEAYNYGTLFAAANPQFGDKGDHIKKCMHVIINELDTKGAQPTTKQMGIARSLHHAFTQCQAVQMRVIQEITTELLNTGNISDEICVWWHEYKMGKLEELIREKHPNSENPDELDFTKQFDHIKSAYIEALGAEFGLKGVDAAGRDIHRPRNLYFNSGLFAQYRNKLNLLEFARWIAMDINNPNKDTSRLDKLLINSWYLAGNCDADFAFYDEDKNYADLPEPTAKQKDDCSGVYFMSIDEALMLLKHDLVGLAA